MIIEFLFDLRIAKPVSESSDRSVAMDFSSDALGDDPQESWIFAILARAASVSLSKSMLVKLSMKSAGFVRFGMRNPMLSK